MAWWDIVVPVLKLLIPVLVRIFSKPPPAPPPQIVKKAPEILKEDPKDLIRKARESMGVDCINYYNIGVCGKSGVGKSSFVNGFLSLEDNEACDVGEVETTQKTRCYSSGKWPFLKVWDIPGAGTPGHPAKTYFLDKKLYAFDAILLLSSDRFMEVDFDILKSAHEFGTPCVFVRTKCDIAVASRAKRDKVTAFEASQRLRTDVSRSLHKGLAHSGMLGAPIPQLFFISNNFFSPDDPDKAYYLYYRQKPTDTSLPSMDERQLVNFLVDIAHRRLGHAAHSLVA